MQALLFAALDVVAPFMCVTQSRQTSTQRRTTCMNASTSRLLSPLRNEAREAAELLRSASKDNWSLDALADRVHLSPAQLRRVFISAYGKSPLAYLTMLRVQNLARLLRDTDLPIERAVAEVGWRSRGHAARLFRQHVGVNPLHYRQSRTDRPA
jgi:transcriptional regulator GlxA family with amidase domain